MKNIAREIELKYGIHCFDACVLLSMSPFIQREKIGTFIWNCHAMMMTITEIIGVSIIVLVCTGQHAEKQQPKQRKHRTKHNSNTKETVKKKEKKLWRKKKFKARAANIRVHEFQHFFFFFSISFSSAVRYISLCFPSSFVSESVLFSFLNMNV